MSGWELCRAGQSIKVSRMGVILVDDGGCEQAVGVMSEEGAALFVAVMERMLAGKVLPEDG